MEQNNRKEGIIIYLGFNIYNDRYGLLTGDDWDDEGLHCGETLEALLGGEWIPTRIEYDPNIKHSNGWYLVGLKKVPLELLTVRRGKTGNGRNIY